MLVWTEERLAHLFSTYRDRYWPGRLRRVRVRIGATVANPDADGEYDIRLGVITVDVERHASDYAIRSTLLHEMAHAAAGTRSRGHDSLFLRELELLLERGARMEMGLPETGNVPSLASVPESFPRVRRALARAYRQRVNADQDLPEYAFDTTQLCAAFQTIGATGATFPVALRRIGQRYGLVDVDGRMRDSFRPLLLEFRQAHRSGRQLWKAWQQHQRRQ